MFVLEPTATSTGVVTVTVCFTDCLSQNYHRFAYVRLQLLVITIVYIVDISSDDFISCVLRLSIDIAEKRGIISGSSYSPNVFWHSFCNSYLHRTVATMGNGC